jgi:predicted lipoprotein with Yx(FWY)xxD motif
MRKLLISLIVLALPLALAACGSGGSSTASQSTSGSTSTESAGAGSSGPATVAVADSKLGKILVDAKGMTLYLFEKDSNGKSACNAGCAGLWPALTVKGKPAAGQGVDASLLGTTTRDDGSTQVTYAGHPLYRYAKDQTAGDVNGEEVGNVWYAVGPDGKKIEQDDSSGGGYGY